MTGKQQVAARRLRRYLQVSFWVEVTVGGLLIIIIIAGVLAVGPPLMCLVALVPAYLIFHAVRVRRTWGARLDVFDERARTAEN